ncbi:MAG: purine-nucleoside phosphorylase [Flavobacteriales bacterium]|nr:purine-nucleoside phosphorylase [Flavobacteriales bacterium]
MLKKIHQTADFIFNQIQDTPDIAIVLGSGLKNLQNEVDIIKTIPYGVIPNFPNTTVEGHTGNLIFGMLEGKKILMMSGRFHYYEGFSIKEVTFPIRVFKQLGINKLVLSNASGGVNPNFKIGDVMLIKDHINMMPEHPLRGKNYDELGPRFVDMSCAYDLEYLEIAEKHARKNNIAIHEGIYLALQGPTFETPAEYGMVINLGADTVGMSTVPEVIVAKHQGMRCFGISVITDLGNPDTRESISHEDVLNAANIAMPKIIKIVKGLVSEI